jgi:hypothetical protein
MLNVKDCQTSAAVSMRGDGNWTAGAACAEFHA